MNNIYQALKDANQEIDSHESDLYVKSTPISEELTKNELNKSRFRSQKDGQIWIELPFSFQPFWDRKIK